MGPGPAAGAVYAQSLTMTANVPFNFVISGQTMSPRVASDFQPACSSHR